MNLSFDRDTRELDDVVVYLPSGEKHRQWGQTNCLQPEATPGENLAACGCRPCLGKPLVGQTRVFIRARDKRFRNSRRNPGVLHRHDRPFQRNLQHFIHGFHEVYL